MKIHKIMEVNVVPFLEKWKKKQLDEIPNAVLDEWGSKWGFDAVYLIGIWERTEMPVNPKDPHFRSLFEKGVPWKKKDIGFSPFSVQSYEVAKDLGGKKSLEKLKKQLNKRGIRLLLDFVPNHTAKDHLWTKDHPEYYVKDQKGKIVSGSSGSGDPWTDTAQLDYSQPLLRKAMLKELKNISKMADGARCDMSHLVLNAVFDRNWESFSKNGDCSALPEFWESARDVVGKDFYLMAEVYGGHAYRLVELGFDAVYDKEDGFYDRTVRHLVYNERSLPSGDIEGHVQGCNSVTVTNYSGTHIYGDTLVKFLETHDEEPAAKLFGKELVHALKIMLEQYGDPHGPLLFCESQLEGRQIKTPVLLKIFPEEVMDESIPEMYEKLLAIKKWVKPFFLCQWVKRESKK